MAEPSRFYAPTKRLLDVAAASVGLIVAAPIMVVTAAAVRQNLGSPVLFKQERPGKDEKIFTLYKFRSMRDVDLEKGLVTDADRLTKFGKLLRSSSLDELPSLWNVLKGDMSLVGPRPLLVEYLGLYTEEQRRRHLVRPGITGLAQASGRNGLEWEETFALDVEYVDNRSLGADARILLQTLLTVLRREGISYPGQATIHRFEGAN
ncbi:sugar transferase [Schaalia sp. JY-X159]|uniref:sugar transferase n=1 Tax=Schaalia sp. JY-X159 TaxID=2758575 RepID=UPI002934DE8A|nr:sugar transferase [Schaalia sp. JY-X159]